VAIRHRVWPPLLAIRRSALGISEWSDRSQTLGSGPLRSRLSKRIRRTKRYEFPLSRNGVYKRQRFSWRLNQPNGKPDRFTCRSNLDVPISNHRFVGVTDDTVSFRRKSYRHGIRCGQ
jgi:hypothetical protein